MAEKLSALQHLTELSMHIALDDLLSLRETAHAHSLDVYHLQPSEGYERLFSECPFCAQTYNHDFVVGMENRASELLARRLLSLNRVSYTNAWRTS